MQWRRQVFLSLFSLWQCDWREVQEYTRSHTAKKAYGELYASVIVIHIGLRAMAARNESRHRRRTKAALIVQTQWRLYKAWSSYKETQKATIILQCLWRGRIGRKELQKLKMNARDVGALREAKGQGIVKTCYSLYCLQIPTSMAFIWSREDKYIWSHHSNN